MVTAEFTFFVDADVYAMAGAELMAVEQDLFDHGIASVDIPTEFGADLGERIPVRVVGEPKGLRFYAKLLSISDTMQLDELERVVGAAERRAQQQPGDRYGDRPGDQARDRYGDQAGDQAGG